MVCVCRIPSYPWTEVWSDGYNLLTEVLHVLLLLGYPPTPRWWIVSLALTDFLINHWISEEKTRKIQFLIDLKLKFPAINVTKIWYLIHSFFNLLMWSIPNKVPMVLFLARWNMLISYFLREWWKCWTV